MKSGDRGVGIAPRTEPFSLAVLVAGSLLLLVACSGEADGTDSAAAEPASTASSSERGRGETPDPCELLRSTLPEVLEVDLGAVSFDAGGGGHPYCEAKWPKPGVEERRAEHDRLWDEYSKRMLAAKGRGEPFDEKAPYLATHDKVMLTVAGTEFRDVETAIGALEGLVGRLAEGVTVETEDTTATFKSRYDEWLDGVGDRAAWSDQPSKLSVVAKGRMFHLDVRVDEWTGTRPPEEELAEVVAVNKPVAIELAERVIEEL